MDISTNPFLYRLMKYLEEQGVRRIILLLYKANSSIIEQVQKDNPKVYGFYTRELRYWRCLAKLLASCKRKGEESRL
ncbi:hypothetical protein O9929_00850 [Vibrio lentus]|nr:hypothetical protein [Vibrio lentus]